MRHDGGARLAAWAAGITLALAATFTMSSPRDVVESNKAARSVAAGSYFLVALPLAIPAAFVNTFVRHHLFRALELWLAVAATTLAFYYVVAGWAAVATIFGRLDAAEGFGQVIFIIILFGGTLGGVVWIGLLVYGAFASAGAAARGELLYEYPGWRAVKWTVVLGGTSGAVGLICGLLIWLSQLSGC